VRVLHVASGREWRGGQRQTWLLARELAKLDVAQTVVTRRGSELARRLRLAGIHVQPCGWTMGLDPRALIAILHEARRAPAVLHAHDPHAFTLAAVAGRRARCPVVVTRRATFPLRRPRPWREADRVVAISDAVRRQLIADGVPPERIAVVTSGIDLTAAGTATRGDFRARLGLEPGAALVVTVAALTREKGLDTLIAAASRLRMRTPPVHWAIAGTGPLARELGSLASAGEVGRTVHLLGHLNDPAGLLAEADCVVMASTSEGFGSSLLDAMALGRPVICWP
jgi:glycosyltransferase involved in cell wall biosynthesis